MKVLVSAASRHGATAEIARAIGGELAAEGLEVTTMPPDQVSALDDYDAIVLGSAVYAGRWLPAARALAGRLSGQGAERPVWLFSSGPVGDPPKPAGDPADVPKLVAATGARAHRVFCGRIQRALLGPVERVVTTALRVPDRDDRDWAQIAAWAHQIAEELRATASERARP